MSPRDWIQAICCLLMGAAVGGIFVWLIDFIHDAKKELDDQDP